MLEYLQGMARYNRWMTRKLYAKVQLLAADEINSDHSVFFSSILGTLNHQPHHRGQVTTLLFQAGIPPEATDLLVMMEA